MAKRACLDKKMEENICGKKTLQSCGKLKVLDFLYVQKLGIKDVSSTSSTEWGGEESRSCEMKTINCLSGAGPPH